jgi:hypothetical protein
MAAIVRITGGHVSKKDHTKWSDEQFARVQKIFNLSDKRDANYLYLGTEVVDDDDLQFLLSLGLEPTIKTFKSIMQSTGWPQPSTPISTEIMSVYTAESFVCSVTDVLNLNDQCTDGLREYLKEGWRILAICPQPGQRRPDYILGKK